MKIVSHLFVMSLVALGAVGGFLLAVIESDGLGVALRAGQVRMDRGFVVIRLDEGDLPARPILGSGSLPGVAVETNALNPLLGSMVRWHCMQDSSSSDRGGKVFFSSWQTPHCS